MAIPVVVPLTIVGSLLAYWGGTLSNPKHPAALCLLIPASMFFDVSAEPPGLLRLDQNRGQRCTGARLELRRGVSGHPRGTRLGATHGTGLSNENAHRGKRSGRAEKL